MGPAFLNQPCGFWDRTLSLFFPAYCLECGTRVGRLSLAGLCAGCWAGQSWLHGSKPSVAVRGSRLASQRVAGVYEGGLRQAIHAWKFGLRASFLRPFARILAQTCAGLQVGAVCWVPASRASLKQRGFDQSGELAARLAGLLELECLPVLSRLRQGLAQRGLGRQERLRNARGLFLARIPPRLMGKAWLLVDDVMTTGATLADAARALAAAGAGDVHATVLARGRS